MITAIDPHSPVPPYEQVRSQIRRAIDRGELQPDQRLPTVRRLAADLGLAANTVARAYRELEAAGQLETRGRHGTFVVGQPTERRQQASQATLDFIERMKRLGLGPLEIMATLRRQLDSEDAGSQGSGSSPPARDR